MKRKKLLKKIEALLSADRRAQIAKVDSLEKILKKLDKKAVAFRERLEEAKEDERRRELLRKLDVLEAQRAKGEKLLKELEALSDAS